MPNKDIYTRRRRLNQCVQCCRPSFFFARCINCRKVQRKANAAWCRKNPDYNREYRREHKR